MRLTENDPSVLFVFVFFQTEASAANACSQRLAAKPLGSKALIKKDHKAFVQKRPINRLQLPGHELENLADDAGKSSR